MHFIQRSWQAILSFVRRQRQFCAQCCTSPEHLNSSMFDIHEGMLPYLLQWPCGGRPYGLYCHHYCHKGENGNRPAPASEHTINEGLSAFVLQKLKEHDATYKCSKCTEADVGRHFA